MKQPHIFVSIALILTILLIKTAHGVTMDAYYAQQPAHEASFALVKAGFPQSGNGTLYIHPEKNRDPYTIYDIYFPTNQEIDQWYTILTDKPVIYQFLNGGAVEQWRATVSGTNMSAVGITPYGAKAKLLPSLK